LPPRPVGPLSGVVVPGVAGAGFGAAGAAGALGSGGPEIPPTPGMSISLSGVPGGTSTVTWISWPVASRTVIVRFSAEAGSVNAANAVTATSAVASRV